MPPLQGTTYQPAVICCSYRLISPTTICCFARPSCVERCRSLVSCIEYVVGIILWVCLTRYLCQLCRKKYCRRCVRIHYRGGTVTETSWICYSCRGLCACAACRKHSPPSKKSIGAVRPRRASRALRSASPVSVRQIRGTLRSTSPVEPAVRQLHSHSKNGLGALRSASPVEHSVGQIRSPSKKGPADAGVESSQRPSDPASNPSVLPYTIVQMPRALRSASPPAPQPLIPCYWIVPPPPLVIYLLNEPLQPYWPLQCALRSASQAELSPCALRSASQSELSQYWPPPASSATAPLPHAPVSSLHLLATVSAHCVAHR